MTLAAGDLTTPQQLTIWMANAPTAPSAILSQLITSMTGLIYGQLNRARIYSQTFTRTFDGVGNMQLVLPDYPVTKVISVVQGAQAIGPSALGQSPGYGWRCPLWSGNMPGENATLELVNGYFYQKPQNVVVTYQAGYLVQAEPATIPATPGPYTVLAQQPQGLWSRDNGVTYTNGTPLLPVATITGPGQYIPPPDATPGLYTFGVADQGLGVLISYSFIPAALEEACNQMVAERYSYRSRIGEISKSLGGQETIRYMRGGTRPWNSSSSLPPEVMDLIWPYVSVVYPLVGAPV